MLSTKANKVYIIIRDKIEDDLVEYEVNYQSITE